MTLIWFGGTGIVTPATLRLFWIGLPAAVLGTWLGLKLYGKLDEATFRIVVLVLLLASGLTLLPWPWSKDGSAQHLPFCSRVALVRKGPLILGGLSEQPIPKRDDLCVAGRKFRVDNPIGVLERKRHIDWHDEAAMQ